MPTYVCEERICATFSRRQTPAARRQIAYNERRWFLQKRYSQFDKLDNVLNERFPDIMMSVQKLPPKKPFGSLDASLIAMRQKSLDAYLQALLARPVLARSEFVREFLGSRPLRRIVFSDECGA